MAERPTVGCRKPKPKCYFLSLMAHVAAGDRWGAGGGRRGEGRARAWARGCPSSGAQRTWKPPHRTDAPTRLRHALTRLPAPPQVNEVRHPTGIYAQSQEEVHLAATKLQANWRRRSATHSTRGRSVVRDATG